MHSMLFDDSGHLRGITKGSFPTLLQKHSFHRARAMLSLRKSYAITVQYLHF